jgi:hypothetical protein
MAAKKRIYMVSSEDGERLIEASSKSQAISFVANSQFDAEVATQSELVRLISTGTSVEGMDESTEAA